MIIERKVCGVTKRFELTHEELFSAYAEWEHILDMELVGLWCSTDFDSKEDIDQIAYIMRKNIDKYGMDTIDALNEARAEYDEEKEMVEG